MTVWLIGLTIKATLLLLCVAAVATGLRRSAAATRHLVWVTGLLALVLLPLLGVLAPSWSPAWAVDRLPSYLLELPAVDARALTPVEAVTLPRGSVVIRGGGIAASSAHASSPRRIPVADRPGNGLAAARVARAVGAAMPFGLLIAWGCGVVVAVSWLGVGFARRARLRRRAVQVEAGTIARAQDAAARSLGMRRPVRLLLGDSRVVPMTWGVVRPVLLLPAAAEEWSTRRLTTVLLHELAHIKRRDALSRLLAQLACSAFWFHPLAWLAARSMLREQERACDDVVLLTGADPHQYAETLVAIARQFRSPRPSVVGALAFARRSNLECRLLSILDPLERRKKLSPFHKVLVVTVLAGLALPLAGFRPASSAQEPAGVQATSAPKPDGGQQANQQSKPRPRGGVVVVAPRADVVMGQSAVVAPRVEASGAGVAVVAPRADVVVGQGAVVAPRVESTGAGVAVVAPRADAVPRERAVAAPAGPQRPVVRGVGASNRIRLKAEGVVRIGATVADVELQEDGWLVLTELHRRLEFRQSGGRGVDLVYSVDGAEAEFDDEARQWADELLGHIAEMGNLRGNLFISLSRSEVGGELAPVAFGPLELTMEPFEAAMEPLELTMEPFELAMEPLELTMEPFEFTMESVDMTMEPFEFSMEPLELTMEPFEFAMEPLELTLEPLELTVEPLELAIEHPLTVDGRIRFDHAHSWSTGGSRYVALWRGPVDVGATVEEIEVGPEGHLVIDERSADGVHRRLYVFGVEGGEPTFEWFIDGNLTPFDDDGRAWLQPVLDWLLANGGAESALR